MNSIRAPCFFVTHYPIIYTLLKEEAEMKKKKDPTADVPEVQCCHMDYLQDEKDNTKIIFLYRVVPGVAHRSFGLNVAHLAGIPVSVIKRAAEMSEKFEEQMKSQSHPKAPG